jgi:hypothetical protein
MNIGSIILGNQIEDQLEVLESARPRGALTRDPDRQQGSHGRRAMPIRRDTHRLMDGVHEGESRPLLGLFLVSSVRL